MTFHDKECLSVDSNHHDFISSLDEECHDHNIGHHDTHGITFHNHIDCKTDLVFLEV